MTPSARARLHSQSGGGLLTVVAALGLILILVQGTVYYRAKSSNAFLGSEKNKMLAQQIAEAGVEDNIADMGTRKIRIRPGFLDSLTNDHKPLGDGDYTSTLTTVATGSAADTVDLVSTGTIQKKSQSVRARLRLAKYMDTTRSPKMTVTHDSTTSYSSHIVYDTTKTATTLDPMSLPLIDKTPEYTAFMASSAKKCNICHLPSGDVTKANVISVSRSAVGTHITHHGDYISTDSTCNLYLPKTTLTITSHMQPDTTVTVADHTHIDTILSIDTLVKVRILSWK